MSVATVADRDRVVADLATAFREDPVVSWAFPDPEARRRHNRHVFVMQARRLLPFGWCARTDGAAALWAPPGHWRERPWEAAEVALRSLPGVGLRRGPRVAQGLAEAEARHPREPHAYLVAIGVRPELAGQGLGGALLAEGLDVVDARGLPAYLESSNPRNVPLYERHGFAVCGEHTLPDGPTVTLMWREPQASAGA